MQNNLFDFKNTRMLSEKIANKMPEANGNATIYQIYDILRHFYGANLCSGSVDEEINAEFDVCYGNRYMISVINQLKKKNKILIATSDMYLPATVMKSLLQSCGIEGLDCIFVSCDIKSQKKTGALQRVIQNRYGNNKKYIHVGDNYLADIKGSIKAGWKTVYITAVQQKINSEFEIGHMDS